MNDLLKVINEVTNIPGNITNFTNMENVTWESPAQQQKNKIEKLYQKLLNSQNPYQWYHEWRYDVNQGIINCFDKNSPVVPSRISFPVYYEHCDFNLIEREAATFSPEEQERIIAEYKAEKIKQQRQEEIRREFEKRRLEDKEKNETCMLDKLLAFPSNLFQTFNPKPTETTEPEQRKECIVDKILAMFIKNETEPQFEKSTTNATNMSSLDISEINSTVLSPLETTTNSTNSTIPTI